MFRWVIQRLADAEQSFIDSTGRFRWTLAAFVGELKAKQGPCQVGPLFHHLETTGNETTIRTGETWDDSAHDQPRISEVNQGMRIP